MMGFSSLSRLRRKGNYAHRFSCSYHSCWWPWWCFRRHAARPRRARGSRTRTARCSRIDRDNPKRRHAWGACRRSRRRCGGTGPCSHAVVEPPSLAWPTPDQAFRRARSPAMTSSDRPHSSSHCSSSSATQYATASDDRFVATQAIRGSRHVNTSRWWSSRSKIISAVSPATTSPRFAKLAFGSGDRGSLLVAAADQCVQRRAVLPLQRPRAELVPYQPFVLRQWGTFFHC